MKRLFIISSVILFFIGCTKNIHENFNSNRYASKFNTHIFNDSLELYFKSPADISYITEKEDLKKILKRNKSLENVLIYGKTDEYEFIVTHSSNLDIHFSEYKIQFDTIIKNKKICFLGQTVTDNSENILKADLSNIFKSLVIGEKYNTEKISIFDIVNKHNKSNAFFEVVTEIVQFPTYDEQSNWNKLQMELTFSSYLGENEYYKKAINEYEKNYKLKPEISKTIDEKSINSNLILEIVKEAKEHKIMMINENHFFPKHRLFLIELLPKLKEIGYKTIALEALSPNQDSILNLNSAFPKLQTGFLQKNKIIRT